MQKIALFGGGKIGQAIALLLTRSNRYSVRVCDLLESRARSISETLPNCEGAELTLANPSSTKSLLTDCVAVISALPFDCNPEVARQAHELGIHYFDLTEDVATTKHISSLAVSGRSAFVPQCGLAPGFISIAAQHLIRQFDVVDSVKMRVGALPMFPTNRLKYSLTWSTEGLINEYSNLCESIEDGERRLVSPLEGHETFSLDGIEYEAFNTSGGLGSLCDSLQGKVRNLDYKTIRYPGHKDLIQFLMHDLKFASDRSTLKNILERSISTTTQDKCVILVQATGFENNRFIQKTYASTVYNREIHGVHLGAIQLTTASGVCAVVDLILTGKLGEKRGFVKLEEISLEAFLANEFGGYYNSVR